MIAPVGTIISQFYFLSLVGFVSNYITAIKQLARLDIRFRAICCRESSVGSMCRSSWHSAKVTHDLLKLERTQPKQKQTNIE
jgi:hypothetical protein